VIELDIVKVTAAALENLKEVMKAQNIASNTLRIIASAGWGGVSFNLVLDEPGENDKSEDHEGLNFIVKQDLIDTYGSFSLETIKRGTQTYLQLVPERDPDAGGGCSSCTSCG